MAQCRKFDTNVVKIIGAYRNGNNFKLGQKNSKQDIKLIFGISCEDQVMNLSYGNKETTDFVRRRSLETECLTALTIKQLLEQTLKSRKREDVARMLCLYICVTLFFSTSGTRIGWVYLHYMENLELMKTYD